MGWQAIGVDKLSEEDESMMPTRRSGRLSEEPWEGHSHWNSRVTLPQAEGTGTMKGLRRRMQSPE